MCTSNKSDVRFSDLPTVLTLLALMFSPLLYEKASGRGTWFCLCIHTAFLNLWYSYGDIAIAIPSQLTGLPNHLTSLWSWLTVSALKETVSISVKPTDNLRVPCCKTIFKYVAKHFAYAFNKELYALSVLLLKVLCFAHFLSLGKDQ